MPPAPFISWIGHGAASLAPPAVFTGVKANLFALQASSEAMQILADALLNRTGAVVRYKAAAPVALLSFMDIARCTSAVDQLGWVPGRECAIWVPLLESHPGNPFQTRLVFWAPYIFIDYTIGMVTGREVWGWPKVAAKISTINDSPTDPAFTCTTMTFSTLAPETQGHEALLYRIARKGVSGRASSLWRNGVEAVEAATGAVLGNIAAEVLNALKLQPTLPSVALKQFHDAANPIDACYQAIVDSPAQITRFYGGGLHTDPFELQVTTCESHQIVRDLLGRDPDPGSTTLPIIWAAWMTFDFRALPGRSIWVAGSRRGASGSMNAIAGDATHESNRTKVVIVGGGAGGLATAFWLTSTAELRSRFDVMLYTRGWRLGGKGASGRDALSGERIEEHGLHLWLGFYETAFATMRAVYAEWAPPPESPIKTFDQAFSPIRAVVLEDPDGTHWASLTLDFPRRTGEAGEPDTKTVEGVITSAMAMIRAYVDKLSSTRGPLGDATKAFQALADAIQREAGNEARTIALTELKALQVVLNGLRGLLMPAGGLSLIESRLLILINLGMSLMVGYLRDILPSDPEHNHQAAYEALDEQEFRAWLIRHGAWDETLKASPVRCLYDLAFGYRGGDSSSLENGALACGVTLKLIESLIFRYQDAPLWKMSAGMGDVVFAPLYQVLVARGVAINFFHALTDVVPSDDGKRIARLEFNRQADLAAAPYKPLVPVKGLACWPNQPDWCQLRSGDTLKAANVDFESIWDTTSAGTVTIPLGADDRVVLAVPPEVLKNTTGKLRNNARWSAMLDNSASVATQGIQFWLTVPGAGLGIPASSAPRTAFSDPTDTSCDVSPDTWCDMSHLLAHENWQPAAAPLAIAYFCGSLKAPTSRTDADSGSLLARLRSDVMIWLQSNVGNLWPGVAAADGGLRAGIVADSFFRANYEPSELYVQVPPGSVKHRLAPDSRVFENLYLAGDWTHMPMSGGCVENAIASGKVAANAISDAT